MIIEWKKKGDGYVAVWKRQQLTLELQPTTKHWQLRAEGVLVKQTNKPWTTARRAMEAIEKQLTAQITKKAVVSAKA